MPEIKSENGVLIATLEAAPRKVTVGPVTFKGAVYNGIYPGPVLRAQPGDELHITLVNHLSEPTNLHFHGLHVSPLGSSDNMRITVQPGQSFDYVIKIPASQPPGLYWYHAHMHGLTEKQIVGGLSGALVIEGLQDQLPQLAGLEERIFVLKDHRFGDADDVTAKQFQKLGQSINGIALSVLTMRPGETQLWRFTNQSANLIFTLALKGHKFRVIATDGVVTNREETTDTLEILPAGRVEALVDAGEPGTYDLVTQHVMMAKHASVKLEHLLAHLRVEGQPAAPFAAPIAAFPAKADLRKMKIDAHRAFSFTQLGDDKTYFINGKQFDHARIDTRVPLGNVEEWTIRNETDDIHVFHIHQIHFQVTEINSVPQTFEGYVDDVRVPEHGEVKLILPFTEPQIVGTFMYHCHVANHEDGGMMANIEVYDPRAEPSASAHNR